MNLTIKKLALFLYIVSPSLYAHNRGNPLPEELKEYLSFIYEKTHQQKSLPSLEYVCALIKQNNPAISKTHLINAIEDALLLIQEYNHLSTPDYNTELMTNYFQKSLNDFENIQPTHSINSNKTVLRQTDD